jgi:hypothetical protein
VLLDGMETNDGHEQAVGVRKRQGEEPADDARHMARVVPGFPGEPEVLVGEEHALGAPGRPTGVEERRRI